MEAGAWCVCVCVCELRQVMEVKILKTPNLKDQYQAPRSDMFDAYRHVECCASRPLACADKFSACTLQSVERRSPAYVDQFCAV